MKGRSYRENVKKRCFEKAFLDVIRIFRQFPFQFPDSKHELIYLLNLRISTDHLSPSKVQQQVSDDLNNFVRIGNISSKFRMEQYSDDDLREDAPRFRCDLLTQHY